MDKLKDAIIFFKKQIYQYNIMLDGVLSSSYRNYISTMKSHYTTAINAIEKQINEEKNMNYTLELTPLEMKKFGFRYDDVIENHVYEFPVYKFKRRTIITCKLWVDLDTNVVQYNVYDYNKNFYPAYYNRNYGSSHVIDIIDKNIRMELTRLGAKEVDNDTVTV